jgi:hypothetical protein
MADEISCPRFLDTVLCKPSSRPSPSHPATAPPRPVRSQHHPLPRLPTPLSRELGHRNETLTTRPRDRYHARAHPHHAYRTERRTDLHDPRKTTDNDALHTSASSPSPARLPATPRSSTTSSTRFGSRRSPTPDRSASDAAQIPKRYRASQSWPMRSALRSPSCGTRRSDSTRPPFKTLPAPDTPKGAAHNREAPTANPAQQQPPNYSPTPQRHRRHCQTPPVVTTAHLPGISTHRIKKPAETPGRPPRASHRPTRHRHRNAGSHRANSPHEPSTRRRRPW